MEGQMEGQVEGLNMITHSRTDDRDSCPTFIVSVPASNHVTQGGDCQKSCYLLVFEISTTQSSDYDCGLSRRVLCLNPWAVER